LKTQNSGVCVTSETRCYASAKDGNVALADLLYYGKLVDIIELNYYGHFRVVLFKCQWASPNGITQDEFKFNLVNFSRLIHTGNLEDDEPYILASHARMVFYVDDKRRSQPCKVAIHVKPRDLYEMGDELDQDEAENGLFDRRLEQEIANVFPNDIDTLQLLRGDGEMFFDQGSTSRVVRPTNLDEGHGNLDERPTNLDEGHTNFDVELENSDEEDEMVFG